MADSFTFRANQTGASAAATILTEDVPYNLEITDVSITSSAAATANVTVDVQKNGASIFTGQPIGQVQSAGTAQAPGGSGVTAAQTYVDILPSSKAIERGATILIDSEVMLVTDVQGSPVQAGSGIGVQRCTVTRAQRGTTAAAHAANANVFQPVPAILTGSTSTGTVDVNSGPNTQFNEGDTLTLVVGGAGATNLDVTVAAERV